MADSPLGGGLPAGASCSSRPEGNRCRFCLERALASKKRTERAAELGRPKSLVESDVATGLFVRQYLNLPSPALPEPWVRDLRNLVHLPLGCRFWDLECPALVLHHSQEL